MKKKQYIYVEDLTCMDEKLKEAYDELIMYKIYSIFAFPVFDDHEMIGLISIHNPDAEKIKGIQEIYEVFEIIINQKTNNAAKQRKELTFTQYLDDYADKYVTKEYCESMKRELCKESLKEHFEKEEDFHFAR